MRFLSFSLAALFLLASSVTLAQAQTQAFTTTTVHMRAGPGIAYPVVATLPQDAAIEIYGCQAGYGWCDTSWNAARGWISSNYILTEDAGQKAVLNPALAATLGIGLVDFDQTYWNSHYQAYPWFPYWNHYHHPYYPPYHPVPGPYCYHAPQDPECYGGYPNPHVLYQPAPQHHSGSGGHTHHHSHASQGGGHTHHHYHHNHH